MSFVAAVCLMFLEEEDAFFFFDALLNGTKYRMRGLFEPGFPALKRYTYFLERLLKQEAPDILLHLRRENFDLLTLVSQVGSQLHSLS